MQCSPTDKIWTMDFSVKIFHRKFFVNWCLRNWYTSLVINTSSSWHVDGWKPHIFSSDPQSNFPATSFPGIKYARLRGIKIRMLTTGGYEWVVCEGGGRGCGLLINEGSLVKNHEGWLTSWPGHGELTVVQRPGCPGCLYRAAGVSIESLDTCVYNDHCHMWR